MKNMKDTSLFEEEIDGINLFINDVISMPIVEGVYILPHYSIRLGTHDIYVAAIFRESDDTSRDLHNIVLDNNNLFSDSRLNFTMQSINDFDKDNLDKRKIIGMKLLASGDILYDKYGNIKECKEEANKLVGAFTNIASINNIDRVKDSSCKVLYKMSV